MEQEIRDDRKASRRSQKQHARGYLKGRDLKWVFEYLMDHGPSSEHMIMLHAMEEEFHIKEGVTRAAFVLTDLHCLWMVKKLWRQSLGIHPGSGEQSWMYGIRGVHQRNENIQAVPRSEAELAPAPCSAAVQNAPENKS